MKQQFVKELAEGTRVEAPFLISAREMRSTRNGDAYLSLEFSDRSGRIAGVYFRPSAEATRVPVGTVGRVNGTVTSYRGVKRISVESLKATTEFDADDLMARGPENPDALLVELRDIAAGVRDKELRSVLRAVFGDTAFLERFADCAGSQTHHHAYRGGLLEHTVAVARLCRSLGTMYPDADKDLLVTAALLHDIGKVDELTHSLTIEYTDSGRLVGHVVLGERRMRDAVRSTHTAIRDSAIDRLSHAILSHHGELEWGAPKRPSTLEALILHHADNLDAKVAGFRDITGGATALDERWTDAQNLFRRPLYAPASAESDRPHRVSEDEHVALGDRYAHV